MRLVFICNEAPYPANHGGRADVWRRLCALHAAGVEIFLVFWCGDSQVEKPTEEALNRMRMETLQIRYFTIRRSFSARMLRLTRLWKLPSHVGSRVLGRSETGTLLDNIGLFDPDAVWLESIYGAVLARQISKKFDIPFYCRSHNIEHLYMRRQVSKATGFRDRIAWSLNLPHLKRFEASVLKQARGVYDISMDDLQFWKNQGVKRGHWLPPLIDELFAKQVGCEPWLPPPAFDVGYLGNLHAPNNVNGVIWFLEKVTPILRKSRPDIKVQIAGSNPSPKLISAIRSANVTLLASPEDIVPVLRCARVLVNPIFTGSGVNIKAIDMLFSPAELVTTSQGLVGLPLGTKSQFRIADDPVGFAVCILDALAQQVALGTAGRVAARSQYMSVEIGAVIDDLRRDILSTKKNQEKNGF